MRATVRSLSILLAVGLCLGVVAGCDRLGKTPTPLPAPSADIPAEVVSARDVALAFLRLHYADRAPAVDLGWVGSNDTPPDTSGVSSYSFAARSWLLNVWVPSVTADSLIYEMDLGNADTGFRWTGTLSEDHRVLESNLNVAVEALVVRERALSYLRMMRPQEAPDGQLVWMGERTTPEGSVGNEWCQFSAGGWVMTINYGLDRPDQVLYAVELLNTTNASVWRCQVDAQGQVLEIQGHS